MEWHKHWSSLLCLMDVIPYIAPLFTHQYIVKLITDFNLLFIDLAILFYWFGYTDIYNPRQNVLGHMLFFLIFWIFQGYDHSQPLPTPPLPPPISMLCLTVFPLQLVWITIHNIVMGARGDESICDLVGL